MLNYEALQALATVAREKSFARAARTLHVTQPAISQRIRTLEEHVGELLISRSNPPVLSAVGSQLVQHFQQVQQLESELGHGSTSAAQGFLTPTLTIGVNADSLGTWLIPVLSPWVRSQRMRIELLVEDEDYSFELLRQGQVTGAISSRERALHGCTVEKLGNLEYLCVASSAFRKQHWRKRSPAKIELRQLADLPCVAASRKDDLQETFLSGILPRSSLQLQPHFAAANAPYLEAVLQGWGWGLVPRLQAQSLLKQGKLTELCPEHRLHVALYWHQWRRSSTLGRELEKLLVTGAKQALRQG